MNRVVLFLFLTFALLACKGDEKKAPSEPVVQVKAATTEPVDPVKAKMDELKKMPVMDLDQLRKMMPEALNGIKRSSFSMSSNLGHGEDKGDYEKNSKTYIRVALYDCSGPSGADIYHTSYLLKTKLNIENEEGYTKTVNMNGKQAIESYEKPANAITLTYMHNDRVLVVLTGRNISVEDMKKAAADLGK